MAKIADRYYKLDPWKIIEQGFDPSRNMVSESIFSLGNEYKGVRGYFEEGVSCDSLLGSYFNGIYEFSNDVNKSAYKGIINHTHFMVNSVDWLYTRIFLDGEKLDLDKNSFIDFYRELNMKNGLYTRSFVWKTQSGKSLKISFLRFLNMINVEEGFQRIIVEPINFSGQIEIIMGLDFGTMQQTREKNYWNVSKKSEENGLVGIIGETLTSNQKLFSGFSLRSNRILQKSIYDEEKIIAYKFNLDLVEGEESIVDKLVSNIAQKNNDLDNNELWNIGVNTLLRQKSLGFEDAFRKNEKYWDDVWNSLDIKIEGDEKNQQGIRFCIFQMQQTYHGQNPQNNIGAKGLTGEAYNGHAFWDTETYCLPFYLFNNMAAAKNLLMFRYNNLAKSMDRAKMLDCVGACYPIATLNGEEACDLWQHASLQFQPSTAVAFGIWHYAHLSGDKEFLYNYGAEMLVQISRFLKSRGAWSQLTKEFGFYGVMGPDEFHMMVNNNCYTNYMAKKTFTYTVEVLNELKEKSFEKYLEIQKRVEFTKEEIDEFRLCADKMNILLEDSTGIYEQHEGYFNSPHINIHDIPVEDFPLYHSWSYDRIYRTDMIKQPDVLMFMFLYNQEFSFESKKANYEYYEPRTIHESSLSPSIHSIFASELQKHEEAFDFFGFATRMDLDNYNRNTKEGLHTTSLAAAWVNIVYGFGGMRSDGEILKFNPSIPKEWSNYSFKVTYRESIIEILVSREQIKIKTIKGNPVEVSLYDQIKVIDSNETSVLMPEKWRV